MENTALLDELACDNPLDRLHYFVDWRPRLWAPAVRWLLGDPERFRGKRVLEVGARTGRMSSLFGLLGAEVLGVDLPGVCLKGARREAESAGVGDRVRFLNYSGDPDALPEGDFDFVFSKSVMVMLPDLRAFLMALSSRMKPDGEMLIAENLEGGLLMQLVRRLFVHRRREKSFLENFHGVDAAFVATVGSVMEISEQKNFFRLVAAIRAHKRG
jgi:2-polyprenyl-3-methyl-5-hydroxy-6-metoxy-1,4-benzoquinol methylase